MILEDAPGVGKTMLAKALARSVDCRFSRAAVHARPAAVATSPASRSTTSDERLRVPPGPGVHATCCWSTRSTAPRRRRRRRCSSACRSGRSRSTASRYQLGAPFMVMATQNPIEYEGTYPLPEAQLDRFTMLLHLGYPELAEEARMLAEQTPAAPARGARARSPTARRRARAIEAARDAATSRTSLNRYVVALLRAHARRPPPGARRQPARRHRGDAGREGAGAAERPRLRGARRLKARRRAGARAPPAARAGGTRRRASPAPTWWPTP